MILAVALTYLFIKSNSALHPLTFRRYGHTLRCSPRESVKLRSVVFHFALLNRQHFALLNPSAERQRLSTLPYPSVPYPPPFVSIGGAKGCVFRSIACPFRGRLDSIRQACTLHFHFITLLSTSIRVWKGRAFRSYKAAPSWFGKAMLSIFFNARQPSYQWQSRLL